MLEFKFIFGSNGYDLSAEMRKSVFSDELGCSEICDNFEDSSWHFVGYEKTCQISVARLSKLDERNFKISYVAIKKDYRGQYVGDLVIRALLDKAVALGGTNVISEVPLRCRGFFEFEGFEEYGDEFLVDSVPHIMMKRDLQKVTKCRGCAG